MTVLVIADHADGALVPATLNTVTAATAIGSDIDILVAGEGCVAVAQAAATIAGINRVRFVDDARYGHALAENGAPLVVELAGD